MSRTSLEFGDFPESKSVYELRYLRLSNQTDNCLHLAFRVWDQGV